MKTLGFCLILAGVAYLFYAFNMDVSVDVPSTYLPGIGSIGGGTVANIDLMARRQNHLSVAGLMTFIGVLLVIFGKDGAKPGPDQVAPAELRVPSYFEGIRDLNNDAYRLWLSKFYLIERNDIFAKFVLNEKTFDTLDDALTHAHTLEEQYELAVANEEELRSAEVAAQLEASRVAAEQTAAEWRERKPKVIVAAVMTVAVITASYFILKESPEELVARVAREQAEKEKYIAGFEKQFGITVPKDAVNIEVTEKAALYPFYCGGSTEGTLLEFTTGSTEKEVRDLFGRSLGQGQPKFKDLDYSYNWTWKNGTRRSELTMHPSDPLVDVNFCVVD